MGPSIIDGGGEAHRHSPRLGPVRLALLIIVVCIVVAVLTPNGVAGGKPEASPEVVEVRSGPLTLRAQIWRPSGAGPFPALLFNHGSYSTNDPLPLSEPETLGPVFARHGYVFLWLHRQGLGLSSAQGAADGDQMARALKPKERKAAIGCRFNSSSTRR